METSVEQSFGPDPLAVRHTDHYLQEYVQSLAEKWDEIVDWDLRAASEGDFFIDLLRDRGVRRVLDVATGTGFHSCRLLAAGFDVTSADGSPAMLARAGQNARARGLDFKPVRADWRRLSQQVDGQFDAITCLGNSFTHLFTDPERRQALAEYYRVLKPGGILVLDQRNYDLILDQGYQSKHIYYYCGRDVVVKPEYMDEGLARFEYVFPDQTTFYLNMCPLRIDYLLALIEEGGFKPIQTFGDFHDPFSREQTEFLVHVATKPGGQGAGA
ncbi:MAG: class I SAM-dependent methyltransferase [Pseudomonadota bacterium]